MASVCDVARSGRQDRTTIPGLARLGFTDPEYARRLLGGGSLAWLARQAEEPDTTDTGGVVVDIAATADPDLALAGLCRLMDGLRALGDAAGAHGVDQLTAALRQDESLRHRLLRVLGYSAALSDHLARHPADWRFLYADADVSPDGALATGEVLGAGPRDAIRIAYRRGLLRLAADDLTGAATVEETAARLAELASAALAAALSVAARELPDAARKCRLAVIGLGKCGGRELNYASDVDVVFVAEPTDSAGETGQQSRDDALRAGQRLAAGLIRVCSDTTAEGTLWPVDPGLRPEGANGPLVRTLASHLAYYRRWAKTWEFQALLKARPVAGDCALGRDYVEALQPLVWRAAGREHFVEDVQAMRRRVEEHLPGSEADRQLKLGAGGLRDVEFAVQLLQLVHGRSDETLRSANTLEALRSLSAGGYVGRDDADSLAAAYRFLRALEHLLQLHRLRRTHTLPTAEPELRRIGRALGMTADPMGELSAAWRQHAREVRRLHEKLFYRPLLAAAARLPGDETRLSPEAARTRLEALGYADPAGALRHIEALTAGVSRRAAIQRTLLPVLLGWFADAADPDAGLLGFRRVSEALGTTPWYLRLLRDEGAAAQRMAYLLASSRYVTDLLLRAPEAVAMLGAEEELRPRPRATLTAEMRAAAGRHEEPESAIAALRAQRLRELFRVAAADLLGTLEAGAAGTALTDIAAATLEAALEVSVRAAEARPGMAEGRNAPVRLAVIGMGRLGGGEMAYGSDADVLFVHDPRPGEDGAVAGRRAHAVADELRGLLARPGPEPALQVDAGLRPEGRDGPLVRTLESYRVYYARWASTWEWQALLRATPVAGDAELGERFTAVIDPVRYPRGGLGGDQLRQIRRLKARMESERLPRGADPTTHLKLGRGGLSDVEWVAQLIQLRHAAEVESLRTVGTLAALDAATLAGLLDRDDAEVLIEAWRHATRLRDAVMLVRGRASDVLPAAVAERSALARVVGYPPERVGELVEDYRRVTRRARGVVERVFFG